MWKLDSLEKSTYVSFKNQIVCVLDKVKEKKLAVWGASVRGIIVGIILEELQVERFRFIDNDPNKQGDCLSGHAIVPFSSVEKDTFILLSMENQLMVKKQLEDRGWIEEKDFFCLKSSDVDELMEVVREKKDYDTLIMGASCMHVVPLDERQEKDLAALLEENGKTKTKILGLTCLGMKLMYYLFVVEQLNIANLKKLSLILSWETLTTFHHMLPRTQKPLLVKRLAEYAFESSEEELFRELQKEYMIATERAENYELENKYAITYMESVNKKNQAMYEYLNKGLVEPFNISCEEVLYLTKILELAKEKHIEASVLIEPIDIDICRTIFGKEFDIIYQEKCNGLQRLVGQYNAVFIDGSFLLPQEEILTTHTANEAFYFNGRRKIAEYLVEKI